MFFESIHSLQGNEFMISDSQGITFPNHLHRSFELYAVIKGAEKVTIDGKVYIVEGGQAVLIFPWQIHSYEKLGEVEGKMCIFSPDHVPEVYEKIKEQYPENALFSFNAKEVQGEDNVFLRRSLAYKICGEFDRTAVYCKREKDALREGDIFGKILLYVEENYTKQCRLLDIAKAVGYDYAYLSKFFKRKAGMAFCEYINLIRIHESALLLREGKNVTEVAFLCGYGNLRTFDLAFQKIMGCTPTAYKKSTEKLG